LQLDGYIRVSRVGGREGESFVSPEARQEQIETWARLMSAQIIEWHTNLDLQDVHRALGLWRIEQLLVGCAACGWPATWSSVGP
jgi:hypothetical protein